MGKSEGVAICAQHLNNHLAAWMTEIAETLKVVQVPKNSVTFTCECGKPARWFIRTKREHERGKW